MSTRRIYTKWVLQHLPSVSAIEGYIAEFGRHLAPQGLAVFQIRTRLRTWVRLTPSRRIYVLLRTLGLGSDILCRRLGVNPMRVTAVSEARVIALLMRLRLRVLDVQSYTAPSGAGATYAVTHEDPISNLVINLKTAKALGLTIPQTLLLTEADLSPKFFDYRCLWSIGQSSLC